MKRLSLLILTLGLFVAVPQTNAQDIAVSIGFFNNSLSAYGEWVDCSYGHVWRPVGVQHGWRPYMYGRWVWTDYGWYWVSEEPFGWATFHYGRWTYDDYYGWVWIPGDTWGPAWVEWRYSDDYIGWAPLPPQARFSMSFGVSFGTSWNAPIHYWNFVPCGNFTSVRVVNYVQTPERSRRFFGNTRSVVRIEADGDRIVNRGIDVGFVERRGNIRVHRTAVISRETGNGDRFVRADGQDRVEIYRPRFDGATRGSGSRVEREGRTDVRTDVNRNRQSATIEREQTRENSRTQQRTEQRTQVQQNRTYDVQRHRELQREVLENKDKLRNERKVERENKMNAPREQRESRQQQMERNKAPRQRELKTQESRQRERKADDGSSERPKPERRSRGHRP